MQNLSIFCSYMKRFIIYTYIRKKFFYIPYPEQVLPTLIYMCIVFNKNNGSQLRDPMILDCN